jgi:hypothetical protein
VPNPSLVLFTRIGFAARGLLYLIVGYLAMKLGRSADLSQAMAYLKSNAGDLALGALALGFVAYGAWRLLDAALDLQGKGPEWKGWGGRALGAGSGLVHLGLAYTAARLALGGGGGGRGSSKAAEQGAATAMELPGGEALLFAAAAILALAGIMQLRVAIVRQFRRHLGPEHREIWWINLAGCCGYAARGIVFLTAAWLALRAGLDHRAGEAGGLGDALASLPGAARTVVAAGLALFGIYSLIEARYRILRDPQVAERVERALS